MLPDCIPFPTVSLLFLLIIVFLRVLLFISSLHYLDFHFYVYENGFIYDFFFGAIVQLIGLLYYNRFVSYNGSVVRNQLL